MELLLKEKGFQLYTRHNLHEIVGSTAHDKYGRYIIIGGCKVMIRDPVRIMAMISTPVAIETSINVKCLMEEIRLFQRFS